MEEFLKSCVERYLKLAVDAGYKPKLKIVATPFIDEPASTVAPGSGVDAAPAPDDDEDSFRLWETAAAAASAPEAHLASCAAAVLMKVLYAARLARPDLCRAVCNLACYITRWDALCD